MSNAIVIFGSTTGVAEDVANRIASKIGTTAISVSDLNADVIAANDVLILGSSTWGYGDLQDDWYDGVELLKTSKLTGKRVAVFGCGDSSSYSDTFCDAMSIIARAAVDAGATLVGSVSTDGYTFDSSASAVDGRFVGLAIDEVNENDKTDGRIASWVATLGL
ncbi:MAG: flavodoxin FldA [Bacteroidales bacterium]|nr:flavodoxin FldA [Bacteroidales bacterium]MDY4175246.1 flavodoxin FldA [Bacteroidales bacterium]